MADILIFVDGLEMRADDTYVIQGHCIHTGMEAEAAPWIFFTQELPFTTLAASLNVEIVNAAVAAAAELDPPVTVGILDKKTLVGGAGGI